jgi:hypothetical protein
MKWSARTCRDRLAALAVPLAAACVGTAVAPTASAAAGVSVSIDAGRALATVPAYSIAVVQVHR